MARQFVAVAPVALGPAFVGAPTAVLARLAMTVLTRTLVLRVAATAMAARGLAPVTRRTRAARAFALDRKSVV